MKKILAICLTALCLVACTGGQSLTVVVTNSLPQERVGEMVAVSLPEIEKRFGTTSEGWVVQDEEGREIPCQQTYDAKLIFPATVAAGGEASYLIRKGKPAAQPEVKACGRVYPERFDDLAWENDLMGFRAYGPALQARGDRAFGYDLFLKRGTDKPVLEAMYADETSQEKRARIKELRKTDPEAANELGRAISYHIDHGYGMDCYAVGATLGAGAAALMQGDSLLYPWCYRTCELLDNGPLRFTARLTFTPLTVQGDTTVIETRLITLDAGTHLNRTAVSYTSLKEPMPIAVGIVLHNDAPTVADAATGYITYTDPTNGPDNGDVFIGCTFPEPLREAKVVHFSPEEKASHSNALGHVLAIGTYHPGTEYVYYWGFGWDRSDVPSAEAWDAYMQAAAAVVKTPLQITLK